MSEQQTGVRPDLWQSLEAIPGLVAVAAVWRAWLAEDFAPFQTAFLQARTQPARSVPCPRECGCAHEVVRHADGSLVGVCRCEPWGCEDLSLTPADITLLEVNWSRLARSVCRAFGLEGRLAQLGLPNTLQIGSWSAAAVPVILTIPSDRQVFRRVVAELVGRLRQPFILLAPTKTHLDAACLELLHHARAASFDLQSNLVLAGHGTLQPLKAPGELFAQFTPQPREVDQEAASRAFALVTQFDSETLAVFRLYCIDCLSVAEVARKRHCSRVTVWRRLSLIQEKTGLAPQALRRLSPHIARIEDALSDHRARHIHRPSAIADDPAEQE